MLSDKAKDERTIYIATGRSRKETKWKNIEISYSEFLEKLSTTTRTRETVAEYKKMSKTARGDAKDVGGFVGGTLKGGRRKAENVANRSLITLDIDDMVKFSFTELWEKAKKVFNFEFSMHTTHSHTPEKVNVRIVIPLDRAVLPDEYQAISRFVAAKLDIEMFDDTTFEPSRFMYWPSTSADGEFIFKRQEGEWLKPDEILAEYPDWQDVSYWPVSSRQDIRINSQVEKQEDPLTKKGIIGAFCRTYSISKVIDTYLKDVYIPTNVEGRYTYAKGSTVGGLVVYEDKFAYSHHGTDPVSGQLVNAFDLVRIHKFGVRDEDAKEGTPINRMPSYTAMSKLALEDEEVKYTLAVERLEEAAEDFDFIEEDNQDWLKTLEFDSKGSIKNTINNAFIILTNDPRTAGKIKYDEFAHRIRVTGALPWNSTANRDWADEDDAGVRHFLEANYGITGANKIADAVTLVYQKNKFHPIKEYLNSLEWDGVKRVETLLPDYLGAEDDAYVRAVTKAQMIAAVARIYEPGCKHDHMLTLISARQGIGKSTFIQNLGGAWFSDSFFGVTGKEAYEQIQGVWLIEIGELTATRKADIEAVKHFLSKREDIFRVAYGRRTSRFPRQCVFWGTSNNLEFLRDRTGDRRTWPVICDINKPTKNVFGGMTDEVDQIWAEAVELYREGHPWHLDKDMEEEARKRQALHREENPKEGLIREYLDMLYPKDWEDWDLHKRRAFLEGEDVFNIDVGTEVKQKTCVMEIWQELFKGDPKNLTPIISREINEILRSFEDWERAKSSLRFGKIYGTQRAFIRRQNK